MLSARKAATLQVAALLALLPAVAMAQVWRYVNFFHGTGFSADANGSVHEAAEVVSGETKELTSMSVEVLRPFDHNTIIEWANLLDKGRTFVELSSWASMLRTLQIYAVEDAQVTANDIETGAILASTFVPAGTVAVLTYTATKGADITSDGDIVANIRLGTLGERFNFPLLRPAPALVGPCSSQCRIATPNHAAASLRKVCSDGTVGYQDANVIFSGIAGYLGAVCRYEAPAGQLIAGAANDDGSGNEAAAFVSSDQFQTHFAMPLPTTKIRLFSDQPATCSFKAPLGPTVQLQLEGFSESPGGPGAYTTAVMNNIVEGTVVCCDMPVGAIADFECGPGVTCQGQETNILARADPPSNCFTTTTSTVSTISSTTSTTTTLENPPPAASKLMDLAVKWEARELAILQDSGNATVSFSSWGITTVAVLKDRADAGVSIPVGIDGTEVALPDSLFATLELEEVFLTATSFGDAYYDRLGWTADGQDLGAEEVWEGGGESLISITVYALVHVAISGHNVSDLVDPINITMFVNGTKGLECAYWDPNARLWKTDGVTTRESPLDGAIMCQSTHLSLFAAIARGFLQALQCSQVKLFNRESIQAMGQRDWILWPASLTLWCLLASLLVLLLVAAIQDCRHGSLWSDTNFLFFLVQEVEKANASAEEETEEPGEASRVSRCAWCCSTCCCILCGWCKESSALRDVVDEVASSYFKHFSEVRDFVEGIIDGLGCCSGGDGGGCFVMLRRMTTGVLLKSAQGQAAAAEGYSADLVSFVYEDEDLNGVLVQNKKQSQPIGDSADGKGLQEQIGQWTKLLNGLTYQTLRFTRTSSQCKSLPCAACRLLLWQHPIGACLVQCVFLSSKMRVLLFMVDITGSVMLNTVFFNSTSSVPSKRNRGAACNFSEVGDIIGRLLAIATVSVVVSSVPAMILGSLSTRGIKQLPAGDAKRFERQLWVWRIQDGLIWIFGTLYVMFSVFFVSLFLANTAAEAQIAWLTTQVVSMVEDLVIIPVTVAITIPLLTTVLLSFLSCCGGSSKQEIVDEAMGAVSNNPNMAALGV